MGLPCMVVQFSGIARYLITASDMSGTSMCCDEELACLGSALPDALLSAAGAKISSTARCWQS
jgi:hypothetical protein